MPSISKLHHTLQPSLPRALAWSERKPVYTSIDLNHRFSDINQASYTFGLIGTHRRRAYWRPQVWCSCLTMNILDFESLIVRNLLTMSGRMSSQMTWFRPTVDFELEATSKSYATLKRCIGHASHLIKSLENLDIRLNLSSQGNL